MGYCTAVAGSQAQEGLHREHAGLLVEHIGVVARPADVVERRPHPLGRKRPGPRRSLAVPRVTRRRRQRDQERDGVVGDVGEVGPCLKYRSQHWIACASQHLIST